MKYTLLRKPSVCAGELFFCAFRLRRNMLTNAYILKEKLKGGMFMHLTSFLENGRLTVALTGEIDHHCAKNYIQAISGKIEAYTPEVCILDFQEVTFVDSSGIAVVINALRNMSQIEGKLMLTGICAQPMRVFRASGIDKLVEIKEAVS
ncbi:MAG: STAS domain-containing protein [Ruminococcaceae bacterium]|nr:STAS domain-containing protein [Oscillospiraceae bacterium]